MNEIFIRRSIREFTEKPVEKEKIENILKAGMQAPSAKNQQAWEFIVVESKEMKEKVSMMSPFSKLAAKAAVLIVLLGNKDKMTVLSCLKLLFLSIFKSKYIFLYYE